MSTYACIEGQLDWASDLAGGESGIENTYPNGSMCGYFFRDASDTPIMMTGYSIDQNTSKPTEALRMRTMPGLSIYQRKPLFGNGTINYPHIRNPITDVLILSFADSTTASVYNKEPPVAHEYVLAWCVQTIRSTYDEGVYHEEILNITLNTTAADDLWVTFTVVTDTQNGTDITYTDNVTVTLNESLNGKTAGFGMANDTAYAHMMPFDDMFPAYYTLKPNETKPTLRYQTWRDGPAFNRPLDFNPRLAPNNITRHMERLATAMTNAYRSVGLINELVIGSAYAREVSIHVQWE